MATAICKLMYNITIHMTGYGVRILLTANRPKRPKRTVYTVVFQLPPIFRCEMLVSRRVTIASMESGTV